MSQLVSSNNGHKSLNDAVKRDDLEAVKRFLEDGASIDEQDTMCLAADMGSLEIVQCLVERGADKDKADIDGQTALYIAASTGNLEIVQCLVVQGADENKSSRSGWFCSLLLLATVT